MDMTKKPAQPSDLTKGSSVKTSPELSESDLDKVSGGLALKIDGESTTSTGNKHPTPIEVGS